MSESTAKVSVPISVDIFNEFSLRCGKSVDATAWIEKIIRDFLDRIQGDPDIWSSEYAREVSEQQEGQGRLDLEHPDKSRGWRTVFLPSGSRLRLTQQGKRVFVEVKWGTIGFNIDDIRDGGSSAAADTWRDLWVRLPEHQAPGVGWTRAMDLRHSAK